MLIRAAQERAQGQEIAHVQTFILRISTGSSTDWRAAKTADSVCVLSRRIMPNTENPMSINAARTCATTMSQFVLLSSWNQVLITGAGVDQDSSKPQISQSVRMGTV